MTPGHGVPDPGMQAERTALAWRRTALSVAVASLGALRIGSTTGSAVGIVLGLVALAWAGALGWSARVRGRGALARMRAATGSACEDCPPGADMDRSQGRYVAAAAGGALLCGIGCLAVVLLL
ncbi:DUF202 domain-containing protein [Luteipulveratus sp. YIM 133132]|uniref:DUF202 domain-containing protein n=1 Tax=Luteipulveratus flavus TaxID=3031728 RepID=UPI0023B05EED|nr:DUF202 domain-containing protein [Luteipulveratus sp. YIM 133132]MDE9364386.1 DUF202 domain-containing protein [Luteipulveratus sp. YIM 133132]